MKKIRKWIIGILVFIIVITTISYYEIYISYNNPIENNYTIENKKINKDTNLVIISDLHDNQLGENNQELISKINSLSPDIILVPGDLVNSGSQNSRIVTNLMKQLCKTYKVFYSLGNTDIDYIEAGTSDLIKELENVGVTVLNNKYEDISINGNSIRIGGMYEYAFKLKNEEIDKNDPKKKETSDFLYKFEDTDNYKIMMAHRPDSFIFNDATNDWDIDLVVSGHTHGGQVVLPFIGGLYVADQGFFPEYDKGLFDLNNTKILITSGLGSGKQRIPRFNNVPEIVNLKIHNEK